MKLYGSLSVIQDMGGSFNASIGSMVSSVAFGYYVIERNLARIRALQGLTVPSRDDVDIRRNRSWGFRYNDWTVISYNHHRH